MMDEPLIGVLDISIGNVASVMSAIDLQGFDAIKVQSNEDLTSVSHLVIPGVGHFSRAIENLKSSGLLPALTSFARDEQKPVLGICLGMQLLASFSEEGDKDGLAWIEGQIKRFTLEHLSVPHVGWNAVEFSGSHPVLEGIKTNKDFYFVHSYYFNCANDADSVGVTEYGEAFTSIVARKNIVGVQFHPEKSQVNGLQLLENFCNWDGKC